MSWTVHEDEYISPQTSVEQRFNIVERPEDEKSVLSSGKYTKCSQVFPAPGSFSSVALSMNGDSDSQKGNWCYSQPATRIAEHHFQPPPAVLQCNGSPHFSQNVGVIFDAGAKICEFTNSETSSKRRNNLESLIPLDQPQRVLVPEDFTSLELNSTSISDWAGSSPNKFQSSGSLAIPPNTNLSPEALQGRVYDTAKDQHGCRFLQRWLDTNSNPEAIQMVMNEIIPHVGELMMDQYANFLLQKLFDMLPNNVRLDVARVAAPKISLIAMTPHGTFSVQKMIETISSREEIEIIRKALSENAVRLITDAHGNHVIQKVLQRFSYADKQFIYDAVAKDCVTIAKNKQGCCVLQRCLEYASPVQKSNLVSHILNYCLDIAQDPYGNYVLQYILEEKDSKINDRIAIAFVPNVVNLCMNKFSSNVMEKVLRGASVPVQSMYVEMMCNPDIVSHLIQDDFGNYVLQTAMIISNPIQGENLVAAIKPLLPLIKTAPYAKKLEGKMEAIIKRNESAFKLQGDWNGALNATIAVSEQKNMRRGNSYDPRYTHQVNPSAWISS